MNIMHNIAGIPAPINIEGVKAMSKVEFGKFIKDQKATKENKWSESLDTDKIYDECIAEYGKRKTADKKEADNK